MRGKKPNTVMAVAPDSHRLPFSPALANTFARRTPEPSDINFYAKSLTQDISRVNGS